MVYHIKLAQYLRSAYHNITLILVDKEVKSATHRAAQKAESFKGVLGMKTWE